MSTRSAFITQLRKADSWDIAIIGGGASGLGCAVDAATRGYKTLLLEQVDFAKGTSSRSTKLVHGGVRYLAQGNIDLVREALFERGLLLKNAPHLVRNQVFIIPSYRWWDNFLYAVGLKFYDFLAGKLSFGKSEYISKKDTHKRLKVIKSDRLKGGIVYHDGQFDDSRLAINLAQTAIENGATALNHFKVTDLLKNENGKISGLTAMDTETDESFTINAKVIINATGVFADEILRMDNPNANDMVRPSQGLHLVIDKSFFPSEEALMIPKTDDGRVLFLVPWHKRVIVGTTDTLIDNHSLEPKPLDEEIEFVLQTANRYLTRTITKKDVLSVFAGLRPLAAPKNKSEKTKEISRSHKVIVAKSGLVTLTGGKWTTYRKMAQDTIKKAIIQGNLTSKECVTKNLSIHGATTTPDKYNHLYVYGTDKKKIEKLVQDNPSMGEKLHPKYNFTKAEVYWAVRNEMARTIDDVLARRVRLLYWDAKAAIECAEVVADILSMELQTDESWKSNQLDSFQKLAQQYIL